MPDRAQRPESLVSRPNNRRAIVLNSTMPATVVADVNKEEANEKEKPE